MTFMESVKTCFNKYADFNGRASLSEFWWFMLFYMIAYFALVAVAVALNMPFLAILVIGLIIPVISVSARRIHDVNKSGWWQLAPLYNLYLFVTSGDKGDNRFGPPPI